MTYVYHARCVYAGATWIRCAWTAQTATEVSMAFLMMCANRSMLLVWRWCPDSQLVDTQPP